MEVTAIKDMYYLHGYKDKLRVASLKTDDGAQTWPNFMQIAEQSDSIVLTVLQNGGKASVFLIRPVSPMGGN